MSRQYLNASRAVAAVKAGTPLKKYCAKSKIGKEEYALTCETLKFGDVLDRICRSVGVSAENIDVDENVFAVMLYEVLLGAGKIKSGGVVKRRIMENLEKFKAGLVAEMKSKGVDDIHGLLSEDVLASDNVPKYVRINSIKTTFSAGLAELQAFAPDAVVVDEHIPSLVMIPAAKAAGLSCHDGVTTGRLIIQDKASCFPSQILFDEWTVILSRTPYPVDMVDACAAPGNKTSHLAAQSFQPVSTDMPATSKGGRLQDNRSFFRAKIFAFDRSVIRAQLLQSRMDAADAANVHVTNMDFLTVNVADEAYRNVRALLVDPSCSGSGVVRSLERAIEKTSTSGNGNRGESNMGNRPGIEAAHSKDDRLDKLRQFQIAVVTKAMSFPAAEAVVYSTCSIHVEENESVVADLLAAHADWEVKLPPRFATWPRRGHVGVPGLTDTQAACLIRCAPEDGMNGFFVALFVKRGKASLTELEDSSGNRILLKAPPTSESNEENSPLEEPNGAKVAVTASNCRKKRNSIAIDSKNDLTAVMPQIAKRKKARVAAFWRPLSLNPQRW